MFVLKKKKKASIARTPVAYHLSRKKNNKNKKNNSSDGELFWTLELLSFCILVPAKYYGFFLFFFLISHVISFSETFKDLRRSPIFS